MQWEDDEIGRYQLAAVCAHGHVLSANAELHPAARFCAHCGSVVITACPSCHAPFRGHFVPAGVSGVGGPFTPPNFCFSCGQQFPWTAEKLAAAREWADELEGIAGDEREKLKTAIDEVAAGGPRAEVSAARIKRLIGKTRSAAGQALWKIAIDVASEAAKKILLGQ